MLIQRKLVNAKQRSKPNITEKAKNIIRDPELFPQRLYHNFNREIEF